MEKPNPLLDHLKNPNFCDALDNDASMSPRLRFRYEGSPGDWGNIARTIYGPNQLSVAWFPDANIAFRDDTEEVWTSLRLAGLGSKDGSAILSGVVEAEMMEWLNDPWKHADRAAVIKHAMEQSTWLKRFPLYTEELYSSALLDYMQLLGVRRRLARPLADGTTLVDTDASDKVGTLNVIRKEIGQRAEGLAKKGRVDLERKGRYSVSDELHCLMTIAYALSHGRGCAILTTDLDMVEIFYKAQWFFDTHYRAFLAAKLVKEGVYGEPIGVLENTRGYFDGPVTLYRRPTLQMREVLPTEYDPVRVAVFYVPPEGALRIAQFPFERKMLDMLEIKSRTGGRCTDLFGVNNIHIDLGPLKQYTDELCLGVGCDRCESFEALDHKSELAKLDLEHSIVCYERFAR